MARTSGVGKIRPVQEALKHRVRVVSKSKRPRHLDRVFTAIYHLWKLHGENTINRTEIIKTVRWMHEESNDPNRLGPRVDTQLAKSIVSIADAGYIILSDDRSMFKASESSIELMEKMDKHINERKWDSDLARLLATCDYFRQRVGGGRVTIKTVCSFVFILTNYLLLRMERQYEEHFDEMDAAARQCENTRAEIGLQTEFEEDVDMDEDRNVGPSSITATVTPLRKPGPSSSNAAASYPTPESLPRRPSLSRQPSLHPSSPTASRYSTPPDILTVDLDDYDDSEDYDDDNGLSILNTQTSGSSPNAGMFTWLRQVMVRVLPRPFMLSDENQVVNYFKMSHAASGAALLATRKTYEKRLVEKENELQEERARRQDAEHQNNVYENYLRAGVALIPPRKS